MNIGAIILAAGSSSRMGRSKQMLQVDGEALLKKTVQTVLSTTITPIVVVLGANHSDHSDVLAGLPVDIIVNEDWSKGMGTSIKTGMQSLSLKSQPDATIIFVCDQPLLTGEIIQRLVEEYQKSGKRIVASGYSDAAGVPALFDKSFFQSLSDLPDDQGAKRVILQNAGDVVVVPFPGGEIDLDTMEEYDRFTQR